MEVYDAMRTTFAARVYTDDPVTDETLARILDNARFAPSGGNRQGWRVIVVKNPEVRNQLKEVMAPTIKQYKTQAMAGETPFNTIDPTSVTSDAIDAMPADFPLVDDLDSAPVVLVVCVDLSLVSSFDSGLDRVGVVSRASIYPFVWNILLGARNEGLGGVLPTFLANQEARAKEILKLPENFAVASMIGIGKPVTQLTKLKRNPVSDFARTDSWDGDVFTA